jgi:ribosomal protein S18 acetylase RimI-like enzyme
VTDPLLARVERVLETERLWAAYALADLDPPHAQDAAWEATDDAVVLTYRGFSPPVLFAAGDPAGVARLFLRVPTGAYLFTLMGTQRALLEPRVLSSAESSMWRMALRAESFDPPPAEQAEPLTASDVPAILSLFGDHRDRPDAFHPSQLEDGAFFGLRDGGELVAVAGTHVVSERRSVAAVGNVFTHPRHRGRGLATQVTAAVVRTLTGRRLRTVVLNVAMHNDPAVRCYERLGFWPFCGYHEGVGHLGPASDVPQE